VQRISAVRPRHRPRDRRHCLLARPNLARSEPGLDPDHRRRPNTRVQRPVAVNTVDIVVPSPRTPDLSQSQRGARVLRRWKTGSSGRRIGHVSHVVDQFYTAPAADSPTARRTRIIDGVPTGSILPESAMCTRSRIAMMNRGRSIGATAEFVKRCESTRTRPRRIGIWVSARAAGQGRSLAHLRRSVALAPTTARRGMIWPAALLEAATTTKRSGSLPRALPRCRTRP